MLPEGRYDLVTPAGAALGVVVLHPHPDMGGDRFNPVVEAVWQAVVPAEWAAVRFDFSSSALDIAGGEAVAALDLLPAGLPSAIVGYSFGGAVAAHVVDERIRAWVLVAPPFGHLPAAGSPIGGDDRPKLVLAPAHDQFCPPATARSEVASWVSTTVEEVPGADHFLAGALDAVARRAVAFIAETVGKGGAPPTVGR